jgi:membrane protein
MAMGRRLNILRLALWNLFQNCGFSMSGAVAFTFLLSLFPFCIFLGALAGTLGGRELAAYAVAQLFQLVPEPVAKAIAPEIERVMGSSQYGLLTGGAAIALFFATSAVETLRAALNMAYRVKEGRSYLFCLMQSLFLVLMTAAGMLALAWGVVVGPALAQSIDSEAANWLHWLMSQDRFSVALRYAVVLSVTSAQLLTYHLFLVAGRRSFWDVWPGVLLSVVVWILLAQIYSRWLTISDYSRFYAGLTQLFTALIFFQATAIVVILGAEFNRALGEVKANA